MKSEERHELSQNDLELQLQRVWYWFLKNWHIPLLIVALCLLAYQGYNWWQTKKEIARQESWSELSLAAEGDNVAPKLRSVISKYDDPTVRAFAYLQLGDLYNQFVLLGTPSDGFRGLKATRQEALTEAHNAYDKVISDYDNQKLAVTLAKLGLGRISESQGAWDKAAALYKEVAADKDSPAYAAEAQRRLEQLPKWREAAGHFASLAVVTTAPATEPAATQGK